MLLDEATADEPLDYFVAFSSAAAPATPARATTSSPTPSLTTSPRNASGVAAKAPGTAGLLAAAWPVWAEGGMRVDADAEAYMERALGMRLLRTAPALLALGGPSPTPRRAFALAAGDPDRIPQALEGAEPHEDESVAGPDRTSVPRNWSCGCSPKS